MAIEEVVRAGEQVKWDKVKELAEKICKLYDSKKVENNRATDPHANVKQEDSKLEGWSYLINDITTPFKPKSIGSYVGTKFLMFEFAYPDKNYKAYLEGEKLPILVAQYLVTRPPMPKDGEIPTYKVQDLCDEIDTNSINVDNLLESPRHLIKKFWYHGHPYSEDPGVASEIYMLDDKCHVYRVAYAGKNANGNGNTNPRLIPEMGILPIANRDFMTTPEPWGGSGNPALTLTGTTWESPHLLPESTLPGIDSPPHCCIEHIWPKLGEEGGGDKNTLYATSTLKNYIGWADWRDSYQKPLLERQLLARQNLDVGNLTKEDIPTGYFPCYLALGHAHNDITSYDKISSIYDVNPIYDRYQIWHIGEHISVRTVPMEFKANNKLIACLRVPVSICVKIDAKSFQPAIRKRWYDMLYYSLRNIAGYKYKNEEGTYTAVVGVTWNSAALAEFYNKFKLSEECACDRWKYFGLGNDSATKADGLGNFVDVPTKVGKNPSLNTAQTWQFDKVGETEELDYDSVFFEPYFEYLLCMKQQDYADGGNGGFKNPKEDTGVCTLTQQCTHEIILPWEGGDENAQCSSDGGTYYSTHAYTLNVLHTVASYINTYKLPEDKQRHPDETICGGCHAPATEGGTGITYTPGDHQYFISYYCDGTCEKPVGSKPGKQIYNESVTLDVPYYYETTGAKQKVSIDEPGRAYILDDDGLDYGYSAYTWKAVDMGGSTSPKDVYIRIARGNLLVEAASPTAGFLSGSDLDGETNRGMNNITSPECYDSNNYYTSIKPYDAPSALSWLGYLKVVTENLVMKGFNLTNMAGEDAILFKRGNGDTVAGSIDIYLGPYTDNGSLYIKHLGTIELKVESIEPVDTFVGEIPRGCAWICHKDSSTNGVSAGSVIKNQDDSTCLSLPYPTGDWGPWMQKRVFKHKYTLGVDTVVKPTIKLLYGGVVRGNGTLIIDITIPAKNFEIDKKTPIPIDQRQKFVILASRASNTNISDFLKSRANGYTIDVTTVEAEEDQDIDLGTVWAMRYAGACRYGQHIFTATFSNKPFQS